MDAIPGNYFDDGSGDVDDYLPGDDNDDDDDDDDDGVE